MERFFTTAGPCDPRDHYTLSWEERLPGVRELIDRKLYFVIHAPRQVGKTTSFRLLAKELTEQGVYVALHATCEMGQIARDNVEVAVMAIIQSIETNARHSLEPSLYPPKEPLDHIAPASRLAAYLERWCLAAAKPVVLFLDEIDALVDDSLISVLRQLRAGYPQRPDGFPQSMALIGMRDVRDYKAKLRPDIDSLGTASPFNVKVESIRLRDFDHDEVRRLYFQHTTETGQGFTDEAVDLAFELTQGQPWLVNALAYQACFRDVTDRSIAITAAHISHARDVLIERRDTHLDSLVARLQEPMVRRIIEPILTGEAVFDPAFDDDFSFVKDLGLVAYRKGNPAIANPIYQEIIPRVLSSHVQAGIALEPAWFVADDDGLDIAKLIDGFLDFWREHGEVLLQGMPYHEAAPHLVFMAYLQRVVNADGRVERELAVGTGRADLVVERGPRRDVIELKLARAYKGLERGLEQVSRYAKRLGRDRGYLIIFDPKADTPWEERGEIEEIDRDGVTVVVVRA